MNVNPPVLPRIEVDPNRHSRRRPDWLPVPIEYAPAGLVVGQHVTAVQPDPAGPSYVGAARVAEVDLDRRLVYLDVDWKSFHDEIPGASIATGFKRLVFVSHGHEARVLRSGSSSGSGGTRVRTKELV